MSPKTRDNPHGHWPFTRPGAFWRFDVGIDQNAGDSVPDWQLAYLKEHGLLSADEQQSLAANGVAHA